MQQFSVGVNMIFCCSIAAICVFTSLQLYLGVNTQQLNYIPPYVIHRKPGDGDSKVYNSFIDYSPLNDTELVESPSNSAFIRHKTTAAGNVKDATKPAKCNLTLTYSDINKSSLWPANGNPTPLKQSEEMTNNIHNPFEAFKIIALCDKTLAILDYANGGDYLSGCELFDLEKNPETAFRKAHKLDIPIQQIEFKTMKETINRCRELSQQRFLPIVAAEESNHIPLNQTDDSWGLWRGLIPGTKWCGLGDAAKDYYDLGPKRGIDLCCRAHDHCPVRLKAFRYGYGLINFSFYTKSHCECDEDFHRCLKQQPDDLASALGDFYFNAMKIQCIKEDDSAVCLESKVINGKEECIHFRPTLKQMKFSQPHLSF